MKRALKVVGWIVVAALAVVGFFCLFCLAMDGPLTPSPSAKPVSAPAVQPIRRMT